jgi:hypothetical protein
MGENSYVVLSILEDYFKFIIDEKGDLRRDIFETNVRDYQGDTQVNKDIKSTLESNLDVDFWWLNNGITVLASDASIAGKTMALTDVQVVNGLQTTNIIYNYLHNKTIEEKDKKRSVLVRIIITEDPEIKERVIKATNFQTSIPPASFRALDEIQRDIEDYFLRKGWYYDRRKTHYKNIGKPLDRIISIPYLAQAIMSIILREPDNARARPSSLITRDSDYARVFNKSFDPMIFLLSAILMKKIEKFLRDAPGQYSLQEKNNLKFHLAMVLIIKKIGKKEYTPKDILELAKSPIKLDILDEAFSEIVNIVRKYSEDNGLQIDVIAKSREFINYLIDRIAISD